MKSMRLDGKVALITGAGRGLGREVALGLAERGADVALVARSEDQLLQAARLAEDAGVRACALVADVGKPVDVERVKQEVEERLGRVAILVNAAGVFGPIQLIRESNPHRWIETLVINTIGPYLTCRALVGPMIDAGWGRIINFSSAATLHPPGPLNSAYGTSKAALNQFTRHLASELEGTGVTANVIHPGEVKTEMWATIRDEAQASGPKGEAFRKWAAAVDRSGGDDPHKAVELVLRLVDDATTGKFVWIEGGVQTPIASW